MESKDFDKIFAHKFKQIPGEPYSEGNWSDLSGRMDKFQDRRRFWMLFVLLPLFGLLAAGNVFWWYQWREAARNNLHGAALTSTVIQSDTIVRKTIVHRYDTIYQNTTLVLRYDNGSGTTRKYPAQSESLLSRSPSEQRPTTETPARHDETVAGVAPAPLETNRIDFNKKPENAIGQNIENKQLTQESLAESGHTTSHPAPLTDTSSQLMQTNMGAMPMEADSIVGEVPVKQQMIPKLSTPFFTIGRPRLNVSIGWGNPLLEHKRSGYLLGAGLGADMEIIRNVRLGADVNYWNGKLKADETEELLGVEIPDPGSDYKLKYWEAYQLPTVTYGFYLRYQIPLKKSWTPWFGLGTQGATYLPYDIEFDFENQNNELEIYLPGQVRAVTHWHSIMGMAGVEGRIGTHFSLGAEAYLLRHLGEKPGILDNQVGLKTRLYYHF